MGKVAEDYEEKLGACLRSYQDGVRSSAIDVFSWCWMTARDAGYTELAKTLMDECKRRGLIKSEPGPE